MLRDVDEAADEGRRTMGGGAATGFALRPAEGLAASAGLDDDEDDADGRGIMTGRLDWVGIAMRGWSDGGGRAATDMPSQSRVAGERVLRGVFSLCLRWSTSRARSRRAMHERVKSTVRR